MNCWTGTRAVHVDMPCIYQNRSAVFRRVCRILTAFSLAKRGLCGAQNGFWDRIKPPKTGYSVPSSVPKIAGSYGVLGLIAGLSRLFQKIP